MKRKVTGDISVNEMLELRKQGMSNKDIARVLEISTATVYRYIGGQGCRVESIAALDPVKAKEPEGVAPPAPPAPSGYGAPSAGSDQYTDFPVDDGELPF